MAVRFYLCPMAFHRYSTSASTIHVNTCDLHLSHQLKSTRWTDLVRSASSLSVRGGSSSSGKPQTGQIKGIIARSLTVSRWIAGLSCSLPYSHAFSDSQPPVETETVIAYCQAVSQAGRDYRLRVSG